MTTSKSSLGLKDIPLEDRNHESLDVGDYADSLAEFILRCETPLTIALQGDWGSGKTSLMNLIKKNVEDGNPVHTIWFNTWQYSQFNMQDELSTSLLSHFVDELNVGEESKMAKNAITIAKKTGMVAVKQLASYFIGDSAKQIADFLEKLSSEEMDPSKQIAKLKKEIEKIVELKIGKIGNKETARIVVFIDDLDRLLPERAVEMLEVFKLFLDVPGCVYVLACDYQVISQGLKKKFGVGSEELKGKSFFDKIIQLPFSMPIGQYAVENYIETLLERINIKSVDGDISLYAEMINYSVGFNPRGIKRIFNSLLLLNLVAERKKLFDRDSDTAVKSEKQRIIFGLLCMQMAYDVVYDYLQKNYDELITPEFIEGMRNEEKLRTDEIYKGLRDTLEKEKSGIDLRQFADFMKVFFNVIQLKSDNQDKIISDAEIKNLRSILGFSALTSNKGQQTPQSNYSADRLVNREMGKIFIDELWNKYKDIFKDNNWGKLVPFQERDSDAIEIHFDPTKAMKVIFYFDKNCIKALLGGGSIKKNNDILDWIKKMKLEEKFPQLQQLKGEWSAVNLWEIKLNPDMKREDMIALFKNQTTDTMKILISLLNKQDS